MAAQQRLRAADVGCPGHEMLTDYNLGVLEESALADVAEHLEHCAHCLAELQTLDGDTDLLVSELRQHAQAETSADDPVLAGKIEKLCEAALRPSASGPVVAPLQVGAYEVLGLLGKGGMGRVYRARHLHLGKVVALKLLPAEQTGEPTATARFMQEMKAVGQLNHRNIVQAYDAGVEGVPYLAMELIQGVDLATLVRENGPLPVPSACECIRQAALGLQHAAEAGLVHRDIKPSNLMLTPEGVVKVLDLGLARLTAGQLPPEPRGEGQDLTGQGHVVGTVDYIAPEQVLRGHAVDVRADLYSLGCTLYYLLTGKPPFNGPGYTNLAKQQAHLGQPVPDVREQRPDVPDTLAAVLDQLLAKDPAHRFSTPAELATALVPFTVGSRLPLFFAVPIDDTTTEVRLVPQPRLLLRSTGSATGAWAVGVAVFVVAAVLATLLMSWDGPSGREPVEPTATAPSIEPLIQSLRLDHFAPGERGTYQLVRPDANRPRSREDGFRLTARLREPAYCYLVAYEPDGDALLCFPGTSGGAAEPRQALVYPPEGFLRVEGAGLHAFVLIVTRQPLPEPARWASAGLWPRRVGAEGGWQFDGRDFSSLPGSSAGPVPAPLVDLCHTLQGRPGVEAVRAVAFFVH